MSKRRRTADGPVRIHTFIAPGSVEDVKLRGELLLIRRTSGRCEAFNLRSYDLRPYGQFTACRRVTDGAGNVFENRDGHVVCDNAQVPTTDSLTDYEAATAVVGNGLLLVTTVGIDLLTHVAVPKY